MIETLTPDLLNSYWDNEAVYKVVVTPGEVQQNEDGTETVVKDPKVEITETEKKATGSDSDAGTGALNDETDPVTILNNLIGYRIKLVKQETVLKQGKEVINLLKDAEFTLYPKVTLENGKVPADTTALKTVTTDENGEADLGRLVIGEYWLVESKVPPVPNNPNFQYKAIEDPMLLTVRKATESDDVVVKLTITIDGVETVINGVIEQPTEKPHDVTLTIENELEYGDLKIVKNLSTFAGPEDASFVFEITWTDRYGNEQSRYAMITFSAAGQREYVLEKVIPVGAEVTVVEVDTGLQYSFEEDTQTTTIAADDTDPATVEFYNDHDNPGGGHGAVNRYRADKDRKPVWEKKLPDSTPAEAPAK